MRLASRKKSAADELALTLPEVRRVLQAVGETPQRQAHRFHWSHWRRQHQAQARRFHVLRRARQAPPLATQLPVPTLVPGLPALTEQHWQQLRRFLPPQKPQTGRPASDHRLIVEAMLWVASSGSSWRELPARFGPWSTVASRYQRWVKEGLWDRILQVLLPSEAVFLSSA